MNKEKLFILNKKEYQELKEKAAELRKYIILMNCYAGSGHPDGSLSTAVCFLRQNGFINKNKGMKEG